MIGHVLQDWTTVLINAGTSSFSQDDHGWIDLESACEATFWIDVSSVTLPTGAAFPYVILQLESSPLPESGLFQPAAGPLLLGSTPPTSTVLVRTVQSVSASGVGRYVRWRLYVPTSPGTSWGARFRIVAVPSTRAFFTPLSLPGCALWLRSDLGLTLGSTGQVTGWADQSASADPNRNLVAGAGGSPSFTSMSSSYNGRPTVNLASASNQYLVSQGAWSGALSQPDTWIVVGQNTSSSATAQYLIDSDDGGTGQQVEYVATPTTTITLATSGHTLSYVSTWGTAGVLLGEYNGASGNLYFNAVSAPQASGNLGTAGFGSMTFGSKNQSGGGGSNWDGSVAEIIALQGTLSASDKLRLKRYLYGRYALTIS